MDRDRGFSTKTCLPASRAAIVYVSWNSSEVRTKTTSTSLLLKTSVELVVAIGMWNFAAQCLAFFVQIQLVSAFGYKTGPEITNLL
jgi:hypothetical protein